MTPPAVAPPAPVGTPQSAAPPGGGPPSGSPPSGGLFGEILDSARTAVAEGHQETGTNAGDHNSNAKSSTSGGQTSSDTKQSPQAPTGAQLIAAALSVLTGQRPADQQPTGKPSAGEAASKATSTTPTSSTTAVAGSSASSDAAQQPAAAQSSADTAATADTGAALAQASAGKSGEPNSGSKPAGDAPATATAPASAGQYSQQAAAAASTSTSTTTEVTADTTAQAQAAASQQTTDPEHVPLKADDLAKQPVTGAEAQAAKPSAAATQQQAQGTAQSAASPTLAHQQTGTGAHTGSGSGGHPGAPGQPNTGGSNAGAATPGAPAQADGGSQPSGVFTVAGTGTPAATQHAAATTPHEFVRGAVTLQEAVDAVKATFTAANQAGVSSARISLSPESLGGIKISLSQTPDGLIARVATDHPEAALTLQQSAGDLKRSLEDSGMSLLRLDIGSSGQQSPGSFTGSAGDGSQAGSSWSGASAQGAEDDPTSTPTEQTLELSSGSLVNVLA